MRVISSVGITSAPVSREVKNLASMLAGEIKIPKNKLVDKVKRSYNARRLSPLVSDVYNQAIMKMDIMRYTEEKMDDDKLVLGAVYYLLEKYHHVKVDG